MTCEKKDTIPIKNQLVSMRHRNDRVAQRAIERETQLGAELSRFVGERAAVEARKVE